MKHLLNILDLSTKEIDELIATALDIEAHGEKYSESCKGKILATLFFEPSTRTRLSFETAMLSLGGSVAGFSSASSSSAAKGESVSDTVEVVSGYVDIIAMRHPKEGAPYVAKRRSLVPIVNAGDGGHYHPTQTLADLMTIYKKKGTFENLTIGLCGDLKYGRTVHSLIEAMSRYKGVKFCLISPEELKLPDFVKKEYIEDKGIEFKEVFSLEEAISSLDVLYMTRIQKERFLDGAEYERLKNSYVLDEEKMKLAKKDMIVLHPLPRVNEISVKVDEDERACYFLETRCGKLMREALILKLLKEKNEEDKADEREIFVAEDKKACKNPHCILTSEQELERKAYKDKNGVLRCAYCDSVMS